MSDLTEEQKLAVYKKNTNIIVSAGAGSGKTTVLKSRVLRELQEGVQINNLIILTFTNNAAAEMKERIRHIIESTPEVKEQSELLDSAYITTFDSFAQSLVKKYNYLLNIGKDFKIIDASIIKCEIKNILDEILEKYYEKKAPNFVKFISDFCIKDDKSIRDSILGIYASLANIINRKDFLKEYVSLYYSKEKVKELFEMYENVLFRYHQDIQNLLEQLDNETLDSQKAEKNQQATINFLNATCYDELKEAINFKLADARKNTYSEEGIVLKAKINEKKKTLIKYLNYSKKEMIEAYYSTKENVEIIIQILLELDQKVMAYKQKHNAYEFNDIALKAIELVKNHESVRNEIKDSTFEIMIDEYQDTNDIQETFISYIENNNVYMVGDIKQSIYRFRNANPYIFKTKYDQYKENSNGFKIDLNKNFRSRKEVIENINLIFSSIMTNAIGGANYKREHEMIFGNKSYESTKGKQSYNMEILTYDEDTKIYKKYEVESYIIARDIQKRIKDRECVIDYKDGKMITRDITFKDFVILVDKGKYFDIVKQILESEKIPVAIDKDIDIKDEEEIYILKNLIDLTIHIKEKKWDVNFKHSFLSIARSYICKIEDEKLYNIFCENNFQETELFKKCEKIAEQIDGLSNSEIIMNLIKKFEIIQKLSLVGDASERLTKLEYFFKNANSLNDFGMDIYSIRDYFDELLKCDDEIKMSSNSVISNAVTIMTIHKSKGLEFNYVYLPFLDSNFKRKKQQQKFKFSTSYGFIFPFYKDGEGKTFIDFLHNETEILEELSEKIRLFYVALTRAKEKIILISPLLENKDSIYGVIPYSDLIEATSFSNILSMLKEKLKSYIKTVSIDELNISEKYKLHKNSNWKDLITKSNKKIVTKYVEIQNEKLENKHFSKPLNKVIDKNLKATLDYGTHMHYVFEVFDFQNNNIDQLDINNEEKIVLKNFLKHDEVKNIKFAKSYKEHEILFEDKGATYHGFIDLLVEYDDHFDIIDYKLANTNKKEYTIQLNGYKDYIEKRYKKPANIYLYSIKKDTFRKIS